MFGIFHLPEEVAQLDIRSFMREHITSALNKGIILPWQELIKILPEGADIISAQYYYEMLTEEAALKNLFTHLSFCTSVL